MSATARRRACSLCGVCEACCRSGNSRGTCPGRTSLAALLTATHKLLDDRHPLPNTNSSTGSSSSNSDAAKLHLPRSEGRWHQATVGQTTTLAWQPSPPDPVSTPVPKTAAAALRETVGSSGGGGGGGGGICSAAEATKIQAEAQAAALFAAPLYFDCGGKPGWHGAQFVLKAIPPKVRSVICINLQFS